MGNWNQGYGAPPASQEPVFMQDQAVYVSRSRVVLNGVTFPVNGITAVYARKIPKSAIGLVLGIILALASVTCIAPGLLGVASNDPSAASTGAGCAGFGVTEFMIGAGLIAIYIWVQKVSYALVIGTAGREVNGLVHTDWPYVQAVVQAINNALASRA